MKSLLIICVVGIYTLRLCEGGVCDAFTGAPVRNYDFNYASDIVTGAALSSNEHPLGETGLEVVLDHSDYTTTCPCGIVTTWMFFAWRAGTVVFYVLDGTEVKGTTSVNIGEQSKQNFFEVPLSSDMWIPVRNGYKLGFFTVGEPMITYQSTGGFTSGYYSSGQSLLNVGGNVRSSGTATSNRKYAVAAYIIEAHPPMFVNAPFATTVYTHETGNVIYTASALDLDGTDTLTYTKTGPANFDFSDTMRTLTYSSELSEGTYNVNLIVSDGCNADVTTTVTINLVNEGPRFSNLPASTTVVDSESTQRTIYTFTATDPSGDDLNCDIDSINPNGPFSLNEVSNGVFNIIQSMSPGYDYSSKKYYDLRISCTDGVNTLYSNFQVDVIKNEAPTFTEGSSGYVPSSISVDKTGLTSVYQLVYTDAESDAVYFSETCTGDTSSTSCPFTISASGEITTDGELMEEGYDLDITIRDVHGNSATHSLSVITSGRPFTFNSAPIWRNLPATIHVMENTPVGSSLFKVLYKDENPTDTFTMAEDSANTYFQFDSTTGIISVKEALDFETIGTYDGEMRITVIDGSQTHHTPVTGTITFVIENVNEGITLDITNPTLKADETKTRGTAFSPATGMTATDEDAGDNMYFTMDCGEDSKYFYLDTATTEVKFAREYDMDSGLSGTATCNISVRDEAGMSDSGLITLTINNINDHSPKFPYHRYVFFVSTTTPFFTEIADMAATDLDSDIFGSNIGVLTYSFDPVDPTDTYFQMNAAGVLFVKDVTAYTENTYEFKIIAADSGGLTGTCTITVIFSPVAVTTTTTTERMLKFEDDYQNYIWLFLLGCGIFAIVIVIGVIVWKDPIVNEYINFKMYKLSEWCRKKPKPKKPRRHVEKLRVMINKKDLENDPDNALPWELLAKDDDELKVNEVQEMITHRPEKRDRDYKNFSGLPVFERGKGSRPESGRATVHSSASNGGRSDSESPKYATFMSSNVSQEEEEGGEGQWGDLTERRVIVTPVAPVTEDSNGSKKGGAENGRGENTADW